jgi:hypothetical protein
MKNYWLDRRKEKKESKSWNVADFNRILLNKMRQAQLNKIRKKP